MPCIVIAEDSAEAAERARQALAPLGCDLLVAAGGADAVRLIGEHRPDLVVIEPLLPGANGLALCRRVRDDPALRGRTRVLLLTTMGHESDRHWALRQGASDVLVKPVDPDTLRERARALLASGRQP